MAVNKNRRIIWSNDEYDEWKKEMLSEGYNEEELTYELYYDDCDISLGDERSNLDIEVEGVIVAFAVLGLWDGKHNAAKAFGTNVKNILSSDCDYTTWFCNRYNVCCDATHHDGSNHYLYRVAKDRETANRLVEKIAYEDMTEEQFRRQTRSLRPYVAEIYGW